MVVFIVGLNVAGYVAFKIWGTKAGVVLAGLLGGLVSSTATTVGYARRAAASSNTARLAALVIMIASTTVFLRLLVEIGTVAPATFLVMAPPLGVMLVACCVISLGILRFNHKQTPQMPPPENPAELKSALIFGALYAIIILAVAAAKDHFGSRGLYVVAVLSGLTDMDAITLSTAQLVGGGQVEANTGWRVILIAAMSNLLFKGGIVTVLGGRELLRWIAALFGAAVASGACIVWLWPK